MKKFIYIFFLLVLIAACASPGHRALTNYLDTGIGSLTYDDLVRGWHDPAKVTVGDKTFTAAWVDEDYYIIETPASRYRKPELTGRRTTLTFDRETKRLTEYKIEYY